MRKPVVTISNLSKVYLTDEVETRALWEVDLDVAEGEFVAITGPSGCGKSTLLSIIGLMDVATSGSFELRGSDAMKLSVWQRAKWRNQFIGFIFQSFHLVGNLSVLDNVALPLRYADVALSERRKLAAEALERVDLGHRLRHRPSQLSGGQQQRVAVARAIVGNPPLLLADEPTGNLDSENGAQIMDILKEIHHQRGTSICLVTHDQQHASVSDRSVRLLDGSMVEQMP